MKRKCEIPDCHGPGDLSRRKFLEQTGGLSLTALASAAGMGKLATVGAIAAGISRDVTAQTPYPEEHVFKTLAAVVDTLVPGVLNQEIPIVQIDFDTLQTTHHGTMTNLGAAGTDTPGAAILPECYGLLNVLLPRFAVDEHVVTQLIAILDQFAGQLGAAFKDLPYATRFGMMNKMDKPIELIPLGISPFEAIEIKRLFSLTMSVSLMVYYSEICNVVRDETGAFKRNEENGWDLRPEGFWSQVGYPGPLFMEPDFASAYDGLKVRISGNKVEFIG
jgi:hypothetical protein